MQDPQPARCLTTTIPQPMAPAVTAAEVRRAAGRRPTVHDVSATTGKSVKGPLTAWTTGQAPEIVEHVAGAGPDGSLLVFYRSRNSAGWRVVDASAEAGRRIALAPVTSWLTRDGEFTVEHIAAVGTGGELLVFYWSPRNGRWRVVDATAESGRSVAGGLTSWVTRSGEFTVEHVAGVASTGELTVFWWSPRAGRWRAVPASRIARAPDAAGVPAAAPPNPAAPAEVVVSRGAGNGLLVHWWTSALDWQVVDLAEATGAQVVGDPVAWAVPGAAAPERLAARASDDHLLVFESNGDERQLVDALRRPTFSLRRSRKIRRKLLTILADHHKPDIPRPSREAVEAAVLGATASVRDYFLENSDGLFTINSAGVFGWYDADHEPCDYWPYLCDREENGRDSVAEAIRKAAAEFDFAPLDKTAMATWKRSSSASCGSNPAQATAAGSIGK